MLTGKKILLGITGSIAAYKAAELVRRLKEEGADISIIMTESATRFITPYTLETLSGNKVHTDLFGDPLSHISLPENADLFIIAPATAHTISKLAHGIADNLLCNAWLVYRGPAIIAPAMNEKMYHSPVIQQNINILKERGVKFIGPAEGELACGSRGVGRMVDVSVIVDEVRSILGNKDLEGLKILVTAGPTREYIDPVRFISNRSSGKMGYAIAEVASRRGADVILISGPSNETPPNGVSLVRVESSGEMFEAVKSRFSECDVLIMAAAVCDFMPSKKYKAKLDKDNINSLKLNKTHDILKWAGKEKAHRLLVGFAAETGKKIERAKKKLREKNLDMIVLNDVTQEGAGFESDTNIVTIIRGDGTIHEYPLMKKHAVAGIILDMVKEIRDKG